MRPPKKLFPNLRFDSLHCFLLHCGGDCPIYFSMSLAHVFWCMLTECSELSDRQPLTTTSVCDSPKEPETAASFPEALCRRHLCNPITQLSCKATTLPCIYTPPQLDVYDSPSSPNGWDSNSGQFHLLLEFIMSFPAQFNNAIMLLLLA